MDMSGDTEDATTDTDGLAHRIGRLRASLGAVGAAAGAGLAGCNSLGGGESTSTDTPAPGSETPSGGSEETTEDGGGGATATPTATATPGPAAGLSDDECSDKLDTLQPKLEDAKAERDALQAEIPRLSRRKENLGGISDLYAPVPDDVRSTAKSIGTNAREAVVFLELESGMASGWYIDQHHIMTNAHNVIAGPGSTRSAVAWTLDGDERETTLVDYDEDQSPDAALLRTDETAPNSLSLGTDPDTASTEYAVQVGHPGGIGNWLISLGKIDSVRPDSHGKDTYTELTSTVPGRSGVSGSPLLDLNGEVIGLTFAGSPIQGKPIDKAPLLAEPIVYDRPISTLSTAIHVGVSAVKDRYNAWTA